MGVRHHGDRPTRRIWPAIATPIALLAGGVLVGTPAAVVAVAPAAASTPSSHYAYACGASSAPGQARCLLMKDTVGHPDAVTARPGVIPSGNGYGPSDLQAAYGLTSAAGADGAGTTVAVVDAYDDPSAAKDLAAYRSAAGLPALASGQFTVYNQEGQTAPLPAEAPSTPTGDWTEEESLDLDMISAICPLCTIDLVEANNDTAVNLLLADLTATTWLGARYISDSWGFSEISADTTLDSAVFSVPGVVYVAGADESGNGGVAYPAASPNVVSVGGTTLATASNSRGWTESVWYTPATSTSPAVGTGSGCSAYEPQPSWQASISIIPPACSNRVENDVAADADPTTGVAVYDTSDGNTGWFKAGGTSEATAIIAGVFALAGNDGNGGNHAAHSVYSNTGDLNEVTASNNGSCTPPAADSVLCTATGTANTYNGPTGWGTPDGITAFGSIGNTITVTYPGNQSGTVGTPVSSLQISAADAANGQTLTYTAAGLPAGLSISSSTGLISGTPTTAGTSAVTVTASDATGASGSETFVWVISSASNGSSPSPSATSASPAPTCSSSAATATSAPATPTTSPSATPTSTPSATPSATSTSSAAVHLTSLVSAASHCPASATATPSVSATATPFASASSTAPAPTPSAVSSSLAVTG